MKDLLKTVLSKLEERDCVPLMVCIMGSRLYGTGNENSDFDVSGVFVPSRTRLLLHKVPDTIIKHGEDGIDIHLHSIYHFMLMLQEADPKAIEMLYTNTQEHLLYTSMGWNILLFERDCFLSNKVFDFMRFVRSQADKYGLKGERYTALNKAILTLNLMSESSNTKLGKFFDLLLNKNKFIYEADVAPNGVRQINVCGKLLQETVSLEYALNVMYGLLRQYGDRAIKAANLQGADYKALSHAIRVGEELVDLVEKGKLVFPSEKAQYLKDVKDGRIDHDSILNKLEELVNKVDTFRIDSKFPEKVNQDVLNNITIKVVEEALNL